jgi:hypothetical protein
MTVRRTFDEGSIGDEILVHRDTRCPVGACAICHDRAAVLFSALLFRHIPVHKLLCSMSHCAASDRNQNGHQHPGQKVDGREPDRAGDGEDEKGGHDRKTDKAVVLVRDMHEGS